EHGVTTDRPGVVSVRSNVSVRRDERGVPILRGLTFDITDQRKLEMELRHSQKLESVGRLAAGVAHEINTPVQFVSDSVHFVRDAMIDLIGLIGRYREFVGGPAADPADARASIALAEEDADLAYLLDNMPKALDRALEGLDRVTTIVRS